MRFQWQHCGHIAREDNHVLQCVDCPSFKESVCVVNARERERVCVCVCVLNLNVQVPL